MMQRKGLQPILVSLVAAVGLFVGSAQADNSAVKNAKVGGKWRIAWDVRLGTVRGILTLKQKGSQVTGTFEADGKTNSLSGSVQGEAITFVVPFTGPYPFTIEFKGTVDRDKMTGTSASADGGPVFLGHAGEVDEPQRPWTATKGLKRQNDSPNKPPKEDDDD